MFQQQQCCGFISLWPDASWRRSACQPGEPLQGSRLKSLDGVRHQLLEGFHAVQSCRAACCQNPACDAFWLRGKMCVLVNCSRSRWCEAVRTNAPDASLVFDKMSEHTVDSQPTAERWLDWRERLRTKTRMRRSFQERVVQSEHLAHLRKSSLKRDTGSNAPESHLTPSQPLDSKSTHKDLAKPQPSGQGTSPPRDSISPKRTALPSSEDLRGLKSKSPPPPPPPSNNVNGPSDHAANGSIGVSPCL